MNQIDKVSDITVQDLADYMRITELSDDDTNTLTNLLLIAKAFIKNYTGQTDLDAYSDLVIVAMVLVQDMWDNRALYVDKNNLSMVIESILGMHSVNLL